MRACRPPAKLRQNRREVHVDLGDSLAAHPGADERRSLHDLALPAIDLLVLGIPDDDARRLETQLLRRDVDPVLARVQVAEEEPSLLDLGLVGRERLVLDRRDRDDNLFLIVHGRARSVDEPPLHGPAGQRRADGESDPRSQKDRLCAE
jgi:hypothetical protein